MIKRKLKTNGCSHTDSTNLKKILLDPSITELESKQSLKPMKYDGTLSAIDSGFSDTMDETSSISRNSTTDSLSMRACNTLNGRNVENISDTSPTIKHVHCIEGDSSNLKFQTNQDDTQSMNSTYDRLTPSRKADYVHTLLSGRDNDHLNNSRDTISPPLRDLSQSLNGSQYTGVLESDGTQDILANSGGTASELEIKGDSTNINTEDSDPHVEDYVVRMQHEVLLTDIDIDNCTNTIIESHQKTSRQYRSKKEKNDNIRVFVRTHPSSDSPGAITCEGKTIKILKPGDGKSVFKSQHPKSYEYEFDAVFGENSTQDEVYTNTCKDLIPRLFEGNNVTVFAYGSTGTGKTFTIMGDDSNTGIIQLSISDLFAARQSYDKELVIKFSYIEVYNENIYDLLNNVDKSLELQENNNQVNIQGLSLVTVDDEESVVQLITKGNKHRKIHMTNANRHSSRSHAILQFYLNSEFSSKLTFIDLAG